MTNDKAYDSSSIKVLKGLEAVRKRPGMYIGNTQNGDGFHHMVFEIVDNSIDEALAGHCDKITVTIHDDQCISVSDNGRGIPTEMHEEGVSTAEVVLTVLHAGGKFDNDSYQISGGLHGVGVSVVNALSDHLQLTIYRNGQQHFQEYHTGVPKAPLRVIGNAEHTGTTVKFRPSLEIFQNVTVFDYEILSKRLRELSFLNSGVYIELIDEREDKHEIFHYENSGGLSSFVSYINKNKHPIVEDIIYITGQDQVAEGVATVEIALQWTDSVNESVYCFTNNIPQTDGGTHLSGFRSSLTRMINNYIGENKLLEAKKGQKKQADVKIDGEDTREGLTAIVSVKLPDPKFSSQTKEKLISSEIEPIISRVVSEKLREYFDENPKEVTKICEKVINAARSREAARKVKEIFRSNKQSFSTSKLIHCNSKNPEECEVFLVEGDSAGGSAIKARDVKTQAILPLRGKILNVEKANFDKLISSQEIVNIISVLKTGIGYGTGDGDFDINKLRYHKVVIMTDADVDGSHIRTLLLTFFFRHMPELIEKGHIYIAQPPLYKVTIGRKHVYLKNNYEYSQFLIKHALNNVTIHSENKIYQPDEILELAQQFFELKDRYQRPDSKYSSNFFNSLIDIYDLSEQDSKDLNKVKQFAELLIKKMIASSVNGEKYSIIQTENSVIIEEQLQWNSEIYNLNNKFFASKFYKDVKNLSNKIQHIIANDSYLLREDKKEYFKSFAFLMESIVNYSTKRLKPSRFKGLGEMNWEELEETTMKANNRTLLKVQIKDAIKADQLFTALMGGDVPPRKEFIENNAINANIDI